MPTCNRFLMSFPLEQFLSAVLLRIFPIQNLVPRTLLSLRDVRPGLLLGNDALQIQRLAEITPSRDRQRRPSLTSIRSTPFQSAQEVVHFDLHLSGDVGIIVVLEHDLS